MENKFEKYRAIYRTSLVFVLIPFIDICTEGVVEPQLKTKDMGLITVGLYYIAGAAGLWLGLVLKSLFLVALIVALVYYKKMKKAEKGLSVNSVV